MGDERSAAATLDGIRAGGALVVARSLGVLEEIRTAVEQGDFTSAVQRGQELMGKLHSLAHAQGQLAVYAEARVVRGADLEEGMCLSGLGRIEHIEKFPMMGGEVVVGVRFESGREAQVNGTDELMLADPE